MLHTFSTTWPCLSFDFVRDNLGDDRKRYPRTTYSVSGTQAAKPRAGDNELMVLKLSNLSKLERENETGSESDSGSDVDAISAEPVLESRSIRLSSTTNRIRSFQPPQPTLSDPSNFPTTITASALENTQVLIHDVTPHLQSLSSPGNLVPSTASKPLQTLPDHAHEGYALDWAPASHYPLGCLLSGDVDGNICVTSQTEGGGWATDSCYPVGHTNSVEELQWSPSESSVFAAASIDGCVRVYDTRVKSRACALHVEISNTDLNVMSWSRLETYLLATGADDGEWAVWDLRQWKPQKSKSNGNVVRPNAVANFKFHKSPITSIEWHPTDSSVIAAASADNTVTLWDLSVELDDEEYHKESSLRLGNDIDKVPPQLLFIHHAEDSKEIHWHPQISGSLMVTGGNGFGVFKTISV